MGGITRRDVMKAGALIALDASIPAAAAAQARVILNDASRLNPTPVFRHLVMGNDERPAFIAKLREELKTAAAEHRPMAISAARHSMGGQSLPRDGVALTFHSLRCEPDTAAKTFLADAGTRWQRVIAVLDPLGLSPAVMQSNNDFGIASTFSVNAHGWPVPYGPFGSTVRSLRLMLADGTIMNCSRSENEELFNLAMGGYGLFGVILDLEVDMVPNLALRPKYAVMPAKDFGARFIKAVRDPQVAMAYGRLNVTRSDFFDEALLVTYRPSLGGHSSSLPPAAAGGLVASVSREMYRAQTGSETAKRTRWLFESVVQPKAQSSSSSTRNTLMNEPVANLASRDRSRTDILHEYFVPPDRFSDFVKACKEVIPASSLEFLNVTLRYVGPDKDSILAFAPSERIAAVMSFSQKTTPEDETEMMRVTEALIDRVVSLNGSFYLPYRLHARRDQVMSAYPNFEQFMERKRHYDPRMLFRNAMWQGYFSSACKPQSCS